MVILVIRIFIIFKNILIVKKEIDNFIVKAYKKDKKKVVHGLKKYDVKKEMERIKKYRNIRVKKHISLKQKNKKTNIEITNLFKIKKPKKSKKRI